MTSERQPLEEITEEERLRGALRLARRDLLEAIKWIDHELSWKPPKGLESNEDG